MRGSVRRKVAALVFMNGEEVGSVIRTSGGDTHFEAAWDAPSTVPTRVDNSYGTPLLVKLREMGLIIKEIE